MELKDAVQLMLIEDPKDRLKAEYYQLKIRLEKLHEFLEQYNAGKIDPEPECSIKALADQESYMKKYKTMLGVTVVTEDIEL